MTRTARGIAIIVDHNLIARLKRDPRYATDLTSYGDSEANAEMHEKGRWESLIRNGVR